MRTKNNCKCSHMRTFKRDIMDEAEYVIGKHCGVTFAGIKPASLVSLHRDGKDVMRFLAHKFRRRGFSFVVMRERRERIAVYVYHGEQLRGVLFSKEVREFLFSLGYRYGSAEEAVSQLRARMQGDVFPHEVGVFLGYPLADVQGFMADPHGGRLCGCWKAYGDETRAAKTFERYRRCSSSICRMMDSGKSLAQIFGVG